MMLPHTYVKHALRPSSDRSCRSFAIACPRKALAILAAMLVLAASFPVAAFAQSTDLYWDYPIDLAVGRYHVAGAGEELMFLVWQETDKTDSGGDIYLSMAVSADGRIWRRFERFAGPFSYYEKEFRKFSMVVTRDDVCYIAIAENAKTLQIYRTDIVGRNVELVHRFETPSTNVTPRIVVGGDGGLRVFVIRTDPGAGDPNAFTGSNLSSVFYSVSETGTDWSDFEPLVGDGEVDSTLRSRLQFEPAFAAGFGREFVVFPVWVLNEGTGAFTYQLYLKTSEDNGRTWSDSSIVTGFREPQFTFDQFNNLGPSLAVLEDTIGLVWERSRAAANVQVYFLEINSDGTVTRNPEQVTRRTKDHRAPRLFDFNGAEFILWYDNSAGIEHIKLAKKRGTLWIEEDLTETVPGRSSFGSIHEFEGEAFVFFERYDGSRYTVVNLKPDESMRTPELLPADFAANGRYRRDEFTIRWNEPADSSEVLGYSVSADRNPYGRPREDATIAAATRRVTIALDADGLWYLHLSATDVAGNWSEPATIAVFRDTTPPEAVTFVEPEIDANGFLASNTYTLEWYPPADDDVAGYSYSWQYLYVLGQRANIQTVALRPPSNSILTTVPAYSFRNIDNGLWALSVAPIDTVGNRGEEQTLFVHTDKYIPVTYITSVSSTQDDLGRVDVTVTGRGFSAGGLISTIIFDRDRRAPYDFTFDRDLDLYTVQSDRILVGKGIPGLDEGNYYVGVIHPTRGAHFGTNTIAVAPTGQVKFGDFRSYRPAPLFILQDSKYAVPINIAIFLLIISILVFLILFSSHRMIAVAREASAIRGEVRALLTGELTAAERKARIKLMKRKGIGLRLKFAFFTIVIVISIVLIVAFPLGITMTRNQERLMAEGLKQQTEVLLESLSAGAANFLPAAIYDEGTAGITSIAQLKLLPDQGSGVTDAQYVTITGQARVESTDGGNSYQPEGFDFVWASDDPALLGKIDTLEELIRGTSMITDPVSRLAPDLIDVINTEARNLLGDVPVELQKVLDEREALVNRLESGNYTVEEESRLFSAELKEEINSLQDQLYNLLSQLDPGIGVYPEYNVERLDRENTEYIFYQPIVYAQTGEDFYYRGLVRVGISTENIINEISVATWQIIYTTGLISLIAVGIGIIGALVLSTIIIIPIRTLVRGVETIRDTEDKEELKSHVIRVNTRDEIADLADTVNQMTRGLAAAAAANKDLILGKDTQKMFVPLEQDPASGRKLTTASDRSEHAEFFGYYEGAKGVSGDYFDFTRLDSKHYAIIKCDVAGKGVPASLIMVEVATIFLDYFRNWTLKGEGIHLDRLAYRINDLVEQRGFKGRFAALMLCILNIETGAAHFCHAGDKYIHVYDVNQKRTLQEEFPESPAAGVFPSDLVEMGSGFMQVQRVLKKHDALLLFTDGVEEDKRFFRDAAGNHIVCEEPGVEAGQPHDTHVGGEESEEFGISRIHAIIDAVFQKGTYSLYKYHNPTPNERFDFDFTGCEGTIEETVLALAAVDKVFRIYSPPNPTAGNRVRVDVKIDQFLKQHFRQYDAYFRDPVPDEQFLEYVYFPYLAEDDQYDDLTILGIRKL